eukprot:188876_1
MGNKSSKTQKQFKHLNNSTFERIDNALAQYYKDCGRDDYYDENGNGKFIVFVHINQFNEKQIQLELSDDINTHDRSFIKMDSQFPLIYEPTNKNHNSRNDEIFNILKHCYKTGEPPQQNNANRIEHLLQLSSKTHNKFILKWYHIENAIKQELYDKISSKFMQMVNGKKRYNDIDQLLNELKKKMNIDENELNYLKQLIKRAKTCFYPEKKQKYSKENTRLVSDILSVHNCFLFSNFHFKQLDINDLKGLSIN